MGYPAAGPAPHRFTGDANLAPLYTCPMALTPGQVFAEYQVERRLGAGGMGEIYLARHPRLPRRDALKILPAHLAADDAFRRRFIREADLAAGLDHPNIVNVYDRGEADGQLWIAMAFIEGQDAAAALTSRPRGLPAADVVHIVNAVADALDHAHTRQLLHRDVKPANIMLTRADGRPRRVLLTDFGIARPMAGDTRLTATNLTVGSYAYCSPEQLIGDQLDGRADQYSLACTAFQLLSGAPPFTSSNPAAVINQHMSTPPPTLAGSRPEFSRHVDAVLGRALAKKPEDRYGTCSEFAAALQQALQNTAASGAGIEGSVLGASGLASSGSGSPDTASSSDGFAQTALNPNYTPPPETGTPQSPTGGTPPAPPTTATPPPYNPGYPDPSAAGPQYGAAQYGAPQYGAAQHFPPNPYPPSIYPPQPYDTTYQSAVIRNRQLSQWALVCGILAFPVGCCISFLAIPLSLAAIGLGVTGLREPVPSTSPPGTRGNTNAMAMAGIILGVLGVAIGILIGVVFGISLLAG